MPFRVIYVGAEDDATWRSSRRRSPWRAGLPWPLLEEEDSLQVGDDVNALGYPAISDNATSEGFLLATVEDVTLTDGTVSRFFDSVSVTAEEGLLSGHLIQSTATINAGNSGGPLVNDQGVVVGITPTPSPVRIRPCPAPITPCRFAMPGKPWTPWRSPTTPMPPKARSPLPAAWKKLPPPSRGMVWKEMETPTGRGLCSSSSGPWW